MEDYKEQNTIRYSFIIPHWNQPQLLEKCIQSIPERNDLEIIVVDDGSDDKYVAILHSLEGKYSHLRLITEQKRTAGFARNVGVSLAKGRWLIFADSDDYFLDSFLSVLDSYFMSSAQIVYFHTTSVYLDTGKLANRHIYTNKILSLYTPSDKQSEERVRCLLLGPCSKMFERNFIIRNKIEFDDVPTMNDTVFALKAALLAKSIEVSRAKIYCITSSSFSTMSKNSIDLIKVRVGVYMRANALYEVVNLNRYKMNTLTLILSARQYGLKSVWDMMHFSVRYYSGYISMLYHLLLDALKWIQGLWLRIVFRHRDYVLYRV